MYTLLEVDLNYDCLESIVSIASGSKEELETYKQQLEEQRKQEWLAREEHIKQYVDTIPIPNQNFNQFVNEWFNANYHGVYLNTIDDCKRRIFEIYRNGYKTKDYTPPPTPKSTDFWIIEIKPCELL